MDGTWKQTGIRFLAKPYGYSSLALTVRDSLDETFPADAPIPAQTG